MVISSLIIILIILISLGFIESYFHNKSLDKIQLFVPRNRGMNIDLSRDSIELFKIARPNDFNINCAITSFNGETHYYQNSEINQQNSLLKSNENQKRIEKS